jgi:hypothetical protein
MNRRMIDTQGVSIRYFFRMDPYRHSPYHVKAFYRPKCVERLPKNGTQMAVAYVATENGFVYVDDSRELRPVTFPTKKSSRTGRKYDHNLKKQRGLIS